MPEASRLALLREDIDRNPQRIKTVLRDAGIRREFFNGISDDDSRAVKAFVSQNRENALKTKPKVSILFQFRPRPCRSSRGYHQLSQPLYVHQMPSIV